VIYSIELVGTVSIEMFLAGNESLRFFHSRNYAGFVEKNEKKEILGVEFFYLTPKCVFFISK
jgi:hypothetical protein